MPNYVVPPVGEPIVYSMTNRLRLAFLCVTPWPVNRKIPRCSIGVLPGYIIAVNADHHYCLSHSACLTVCMLQAAIADCSAIIRLTTGDAHVWALALRAHRKASIGEFEVCSAANFRLVIHEFVCAHCAFCQRVTGGCTCLKGFSNLMLGDIVWRVDAPALHAG